MRNSAGKMIKRIAFASGQITDYGQTVPEAVKEYVLDMINLAKTKVSSKVELSALKVEIPPFQTVASYTTGTVTITQGSVVLAGSGTVWTEAMEGRKIQIGSDKTVYKLKDYSSGTSFTLNAPFAGSNEAGATYTILQDVYPIPPSIKKISVLKRLNTNMCLAEKSVEELTVFHPNPMYTLSSYPYAYALLEPVITTVASNTAASGTTSASAVLGTTGALYNDYYKDWQVKNTTRGELRRVSAHNDTTGALTLESSIEGQVAGDIFDLVKEEGQLMLRGVPTSIISLQGIGTRDATRLVNDTDFETELPEDFEDLLYLGAMALMQLSKKPKEKDQQYQLQFAEMLEDLKDDQEKNFSRRYIPGGSNEDLLMRSETGILPGGFPWTGF